MFRYGYLDIAVLMENIYLVIFPLIYRKLVKMPHKLSTFTLIPNKNNHISQQEMV